MSNHHQSSRITTLMGCMLLLFPFLSSGVAAVENCKNKDEQPLEFRFFTDNNSWRDNGWTLECDYEDSSREMLWEVPIGSLKFEGRTQVIREAACVPDTATCTLRLYDAAGDGLQSTTTPTTTNGNGMEVIEPELDSSSTSEESFTGWFAFMHGATTVGTYKNLDEPAFSELTYCVGPKCDKAPQEVQADDENCQDIVYLAMQLDNHPEDTTYQLICGNGDFNKRIIWDGKDFTEAGAYIEEETCLPKNACCEFIVYDGGTNGLTSPVDVDVNDPDSTFASGTRPHGFIYLERNYEPVLEYDGITGEEFDVLSKTFACGADKLSISKEIEVETEEEEEEIEEEVEEITEDEDEDDSNMETTDADEEADQSSEVVTDEDDNDEEDSVDETLNDADDVEETADETTVDESVDGWSDENMDDTIYTDHTVMPSMTEVPTSVTSGYGFGFEQGFADDDYQNWNENDDGEGFGKFDDDYNSWNTGFTDDVAWFNTNEPTVYPTDTAYPTTAPTAYPTKQDTWELSDDVVEDDDTAWAQDEMQNLAPTAYPTKQDTSELSDDVVEEDDIAWTQDEMQNLEDLIIAADNASPDIPQDVAAIAFLNGNSNNIQEQEQQGMSKGAKIAVGIIIPLLILAAIALALYCFRESLMTRFGNNADDEIIEKGAQKPEAVSEQSYSEEDVRSEHSLEEEV